MVTFIIINHFYIITIFILEYEPKVLMYVFDKEIIQYLFDVADCYNRTTIIED